MATLAPGASLASYTIQRRLGAGSLACVYLARSSGLAAGAGPVALKVLLPQMAAKPDLVRVFHDQAHQAAMLDHPNIVKIHEVSAEGARHFIAMALVDGVNLHQVVTRLAAAKRRLPRRLALRIIADVCRGLQHAHAFAGRHGQALGIVHRDVSLSNVLVSSAGQVQLVDFGIAKARGLAGLSGQGLRGRKYEYMAPELFENRQHDHRADIYAVGVVLYLLLLGRAPFVGCNELELIDRIVTKPPPGPRKLDPEMPRQLERVLYKALRKDPNRRYQSAEELRYDLSEQLERRRPRVKKRELGAFLETLVPQGRASAGAPSPAIGQPRPVGRPLDAISAILDQAPERQTPAGATVQVPGRGSLGFDDPDTQPDDGLPGALQSGQPGAAEEPSTDPVLPVDLRDEPQGLDDADTNVDNPTLAKPPREEIESRTGPSPAPRAPRSEHSPAPADPAVATETDSEEA